MVKSRLTTSRTVEELVTGDYYNDWKKTIGDKPDTENAIGHKLIWFLSGSPKLIPNIKPDDIFSGELTNVFDEDLKNYALSAIFTALAEKTVEAFTHLDVNNDVNAFNSVIQQLNDIINEIVTKLKAIQDKIKIVISADEVTRIITIDATIGYIELKIGYGNDPWGTYEWGSPHSLGWGLDRYGIHWYSSP